MIEGKLISYFCAVGMILMTVACSSEDEPGCVLGGPTVFEAGAKIKSKAL